MKYDNISFVVGRFQPFHDGHKHLVDNAIALSGMSGLTVIFIGSSTSEASERNPFNFYKRVDMISETYKNYTDSNIIICPLPDFKTDKEWTDHIDQVLYDLSSDDVVITAVVNDKDEDTKTSNSLLKNVKGCHIKYIDTFTDISGTEIRNMINDGCDIRSIKHIPNGTKAVLMEHL